MKHSVRYRIGAVVAASVLAFGLAACGDDDSSSSSSSKKDKENAAPAMESDKGAPFGEACSAVPKDGAGSFDGMSADPVATAASNNPVLSTLVTAVQQADLVDTLNGAKNITVFAPTNDAFAKIPAADLQAVLADKDKLTKILTYHVIGKRITPDQLASDGPFASMQGENVEISGSDKSFTVNESSKVVCGNVQTSNATVYIVDSVLMPSM